MYLPIAYKAYTHKIIKHSWKLLKDPELCAPSLLTDIANR